MRPTILIADDHPVNRYLLEATLKSANYDVVLVNNGQEALQQARLVRPSLIISDVLMPLLDGFSLCYECQHDEQLREIPFLFYTATYTGDRDREFGLSLGAIGYIVKPDENEDLLEAIQTGLTTKRARPPVPTPPPMPINDYLRANNHELVHKLETKVKQVELANQRLELEMVERRKTESQLEERSRLLDLSSDAIVRLNPANEIILWNRGAERLFGYTAQEVTGRTWSELFDLIPPLQLDLQAADCVLKTKSGAAITVFKRWNAVQREDGTPDGLMVVCSDVTEVRRLQSRKQRQQRLELIGTMTSGLSHDLNNILAPVVTITPMLRSHISAPRGMTLLETVTGCVNRASNLLKQLLTFGRGERSELQQQVGLNVLIDELAILMAETFPKSIVLKTDVAPFLPDISGDPTKIHQVLLNLCINARDAMPNGGTLEIRADWYDDETGPKVRVQVRDTGSGIEPAVLPHIFDEFYSTKPADRGTGLGLAIVQSLVLEHHGRIDVQSTVGMGTMFTLELPAVSTPIDGQTPTPKRGPILVLEQNHSVGLLVEQVLISAGYHVMLASNAEEFEKIKKRVSHFALVILDASEPSVAAKLAREFQQADCWTVALVANESDAPELAQFQRVLKKPFSTDVLLQCVNDLLNAP